MPLINLENIDLSFGEQIIFDKLNLQLDRGQRIGLIGRNGEGKSTLLKTIMGRQDVDDGQIYRHPGLSIAYVEQELPPSSDTGVREYVADGAADTLNLLKKYDLLSSDTDVDLEELNRLQQEIEANDGWQLEHRLNKTLEQFELDKGQKLNELSGGWRRKASLARSLMASPDIILLDEPTNHLDVGLIQWLESFIKNFSGAVILITHDRAFLKEVCNEIAELDRGILRSWQGSYASFLEFKQQELETEVKHNALFDKRLAEEESWIREGIKARRTRNEGRVRALKKMREERSQRREKTQLGKIEISGAAGSGKLVADIEDMSFSFGDNSVVRDFSTSIVRGDKIGFIGPNGVGKSTLLKLILGELEATKGKIKRGTALQVAYFDQMRDQINPEENVVDNVGQGRQSVTINGKDKHILSYLQDFMFSPMRARTPLKALSGGEKSRVMLAKLFCQSSNLLVMDEPTNDLDTETLELLESLLMEYQGTVLLVTHDREFLDNVVTSSFVFEGQGRIREYVGGYQDWLRQGGSWDAIANPVASKNEHTAITSSDQAETADSEKPAKKKKLSYKLQRELDELPKRIEELENQFETATQEASASDFYQQDATLVQEKLAALSEFEASLRQAYARWEELEAILEQ